MAAPSKASAPSAAADLPIDGTLKPDQALAVIGLGLMRKLAAGGHDLPWIWNDGDGQQADLVALRQRLELTQLALETGAPLSTAEVSQLLGARATGEVVERGGLRARRLARNLWKISKLSEQRDGFARRF
ncbi:MAG: hypothetical protein ACKOPN_12655 [Prochlorococcaceae cyanobacterium]|jgi:hypothetical protein